MSNNASIGPMKDWSCSQCALYFSKGIFNFPQLFVVKHYSRSTHVLYISNDSKKTISGRFFINSILVQFTFAFIIYSEIFFIVGIGNKFLNLILFGCQFTSDFFQYIFSCIMISFGSCL